jgi:hypothetical protein
MVSRPTHGLAEPDVGLCATCIHARIIRSNRGSTFYQCSLSFTKPEYPKYPRLPVLACGGYTKREQD